MTAQEFRRAIKKLGLNQIQAALFLDVSVRTVRTYVVSGAPVPIGMLLTIMLKRRIGVEQASRLAGREISFPVVHERDLNKAMRAMGRSKKG